MEALQFIAGNIDLASLIDLYGHELTDESSPEPNQPLRGGATISHPRCERLA
jgi:hypothetical protein